MGSILVFHTVWYEELYMLEKKYIYPSREGFYIKNIEL